MVSPLFSPSFRATYYRTGENSPSSATPPTRCNGQKQKARFLLLQKIYYVHEISFKRDERNFRDLRDNRRARPLCGLTAVFLSAARAKCSPLLARRIHSFRIEPQVCGKLGALRQKCHFATRSLIMEKRLFPHCHPERSGGVAAAKSNGSEQFLTIAVCNLCCTINCIWLSTYSAQIPRLRSG